MSLLLIFGRVLKKFQQKRGITFKELNSHAHNVNANSSYKVFEK